MRPLTKGDKFNLIHYVDPNRFVIGEIKLTSSCVTFKDENVHIEQQRLICNDSQNGKVSEQEYMHIAKMQSRLKL